MKWEEIEYFLDKLDFSSLTKVLDIGCGNGRFLDALKSQFSELTKNNYRGVDLSSGLLEEAKKLHPEYSDNFTELNMLHLDELNTGTFTDIFFIASFHHLQSIKEREEVLLKTYQMLEKGGRVYMTNWALNSPLNYDRYKKSLVGVDGGGNKWGSLDYNITIGGNDRYYHCFYIAELDYLASNAGFKIIENRLFYTQKNFITILEK